MALPPVRIPNGNGHSRGNGNLPVTRSYAQIPPVLDIPDLIESQIESFDWFKGQGLTDVLREISPISDYTERRFDLYFGEHQFREPKYSPQECKEREISYTCPLYVTAILNIKDKEERLQQDIFMGDIPMMTDNGTFVINGAERVVVSQLVRSPGIYFTTERNPSSHRGLCMAKLIPSRGAWLEFETSNKDILSVKVDRKRKVAAGTFLRALGLAYDDDILKLFADLDTDESHRYMEATLRSDPADSRESGMFPEDALRNLWGEEWLNGGQEFDKSAAHRVAAAQVEFYRRLRPGEPPSLDNSRNLIKNLFFEPRRYDLGEVGRHKLNGNLGRPSDYSSLRILTRDDIIAILRKMIEINQGQGQADDIDHLGNRRVRAVGELVQNQVRIGLLRMERMVKEKMTLVGGDKAEELPKDSPKLLKRIAADTVYGPNKEVIIRKDETITERHIEAFKNLPKGTKILVYITAPVAPQTLVNIRPVVASVREFFGGSQLSQFMDQTNPLAELTHKRRLSALGPGGLSRERAGFDVRDVHFSHYGRICPIETPEGPNIGLLSSLASYARVNSFGFIESPYRVVRRELPKDSDDLRGRVVTEPVINPETNHIIVNEGVAIGANRINTIRRLPEGTMIPVQPFVVAPPRNGGPDDSIIWLSADKEEQYKIAQANAKLDAMNQFVNEQGRFDNVRIEIRIGDQYTQGSPAEVDLMDVSPMQIMSVSAALIPFLEHDDANRALMGSNMQRQAVPLLRAQAPTVGTGIEDRVARDSGQMVLSEVDGVIASAGHCGIVWIEGVKALQHFHQEIITDTEGNRHRHCDQHKGPQGPCLVGFDAEGRETHHGQNYKICEEHIFCNQYQQGGKFHHVAHCTEHDYCLLAKDSHGNERHQCTQMQEDDIKGHVACREHYKEVVASVFRLGAQKRHQCLSIKTADNDTREHRHSLIKFSRTNQGTCFDQSPIVSRGDIVKKNAVLADSSSTQEGDLALGQNVLVAFMSWEGYNYEDAIILSERLYRDDYFTSIHIERHEMEARETKLGPEEITRDIPNVGENNLRDLDERGIIRIGADVGPGDILVGKVTPKGETELTAEEKLLRAIFGEKSRDVKDTSLRVPHGERGKVIDVKVLSRENKDDLSPGVKEAVRVWIAQTRKIAVGDKMAGRHGNKGVVARILPEEDMPYLEDGTPVDIILNPIGVPSRMNLGQVLETHLGWAARGLHFRANTPVFDGASDSRIEDGLARIWFNERKDAILTGEGLSQSAKAAVIRWLEDYRCAPPQMLERIFDESLTGFTREACLRLWLALDAGRDPWGLDVQQMHNMALEVHRQRGIAPPTFGKFKLYDGRTGDPFDQLVTVGDIYILKLIHLVEDKIHARSTGPYSMITQQPLGGKAQFGGQRFGEMEVWALEAYSAAYNLQEVLTVKSDDVAGRVKTYEAVVKGEPIDKPGVPESFNVLLKELQSLGLAVQLLNEENRPSVTQDIGPDLVAELGPDFGANLPDLDPTPEPAFAADD